MDTDLVIAEFKRQLKARGYADSTICGYGTSLNLFRQYLKERNIRDIRKINHQVILDYQAKLMSEKSAMETKAIRIRAVKRLFEYLVETHRLLINPTEAIVEISRKNMKIGTVLTVDEIKLLFEQPNLSFPMQIRDRAIMEVLYSTAIRLDELLNLEVYHADLKDKVLYIRKAKGSRQRVVPLGKNAVLYLKEYLHRVRPISSGKNPKERKLFLLQNGDPMTRGAININFRQYRLQAGIKKPVSPHTFRRSCATHMLQNGADIRYIQKLLGHKHLKTTQKYTKVVAVDIKKTHAATHPNVRGKKKEDS